MKRFGMSWSGAGSNSWTNEPTDRTAGACSQIDARGSSWAPLFVYLLHPLYSLLTLLILVHSALQDRKGRVTSSRSLSFSFYVLLPALCLSSPSSFLLFLPSSSLFFPLVSLRLTLPFRLYALISPLPPSPAFSLSGSATSLSISPRVRLLSPLLLPPRCLACYPPLYLFLGVVFNFSGARSSNVVPGAARAIAQSCSRNAQRNSSFHFNSPILSRADSPLRFLIPENYPL